MELFHLPFLEPRCNKHLGSNFIYCEYIKECKDKHDIIKYLEERLLDIKSNNYPFEFAPSRDDMPQVFKGGTDENDKKSSLPDKEGSAMNKLKDDKFMKSAVK